MQDNEKIKSSLLSILKLGGKSNQFEDFYSTCIKFSIADICLNKNRKVRNEILSRLGYSLKDMACDCVDDLFELREERFIHIEKYFNKIFPQGFEAIEPDKVVVHLSILIKSKTNQQISELRENLGEIYFRIKKSVQTDISRKRNLYRTIILDGIKYIYTNNEDKPDLELPQIEKYTLLSKLLDMQLKNYNVSTLLCNIFKIINNQTQFSRLIKEKYLLEILKDFYQVKMAEAIEKNVEYINLETEEKINILFEGEYEEN